MKDFHNHKGNSFGAFLAGVLTAVAAGGYLFFGSKKARRNRQKVDWWIEDAKEEIFAKMEKAKDFSREKFDEIIDGVMRKYSKFKDLKDDAVDDFKTEMRRRWEEIREEEDDED